MLHIPGPDGTPGAAQPKLVGQTYAAQTRFPTLGPFPYTVDANPGVTVLRARTSVSNAVLQDIARSPVNINKEISAVIFTPRSRSTRWARRRARPAPQDVTYTFYVRNGSDPTLDPAATALSNVKVTDDKCGSPTYRRVTPTAAASSSLARRGSSRAR